MGGNNHISDLIAVQKNDDLIILNQSDIYYFEHRGRKTIIHTLSQAYETTKPLQYYEERLKNRDYFRTHRSVLVNLSKVERCISCVNYSYDICFREIEDIVPISRERAKMLMKILDI